MICAICKENINHKGQDNISPLSGFPVCEDCGDKISCNPETKPNCKLIGENGNIFNLMAIASNTLRENNLHTQAEIMVKRIRCSGSYDAALCIIGEYVNII